MVQSHSVDCCQQDELASLAKKLYKLSSMTWKEIREDDKHGLGSEKISQKAIKVQIPSIVTPDVSLLALRFYKKAPMVGFRKDNIFYIIWLDREFKIYDHG